MEKMEVSAVFSRNRSLRNRILANGSKAKMLCGYLGATLSKATIEFARSYFNYADDDIMRFVGEMREDGLFYMWPGPFGWHTHKGEKVYIREGYKLTDAGYIQFPTLFRCSIKELGPQEVDESGLKILSSVYFSNGEMRFRLPPACMFEKNEHILKPLRQRGEVKRTPSTTNDETWHRGCKKVIGPPIPLITVDLRGMSV